MREFEYTVADFDILRTLSNQHSGILVPDEKFDMFYSRLSKRVRLLGFASFKQYCQYLQNHPDQEFTEFINAITTNLTAFFRENHHFEFIKHQILPELCRKNYSRKEIKVWSAGCSTGEEPYSLAMILKENLSADWNIRILATDLDTNVLASAEAGIYSLDRLTGLEEKRLQNWFQKGIGVHSNKARIKKELRDLVYFKQLNLMTEWPLKGYFDFIFCRNVLIYFDKETKLRLANRYAEILQDGAHLFIGHSESLHQLDTPFELIGNTIYKKTIK
jgi:chemotaxis protein methyltransferase CheR